MLNTELKTNMKILENFVTHKSSIIWMAAQYCLTMKLEPIEIPKELAEITSYKKDNTLMMLDKTTGIVIQVEHQTSSNTVRMVYFRPQQLSYMGLLAAHVFAVPIIIYSSEQYQNIVRNLQMAK